MIGLDLTLEDSTLNPYSAMWQGERPSALGRMFFSLNVPSSTCRPQHLAIMNVRPTEYVPLPDQINSMTMFMSVLGVSSIQFNGDPRHRLGRRRMEDVFPMTHFFRPGEGIESLHVFTRRGSQAQGAAGLVVVVSVPSERYEVKKSYSALN